MQCPGCDTPMDDDLGTCPACGAAADAAIETEPADPEVASDAESEPGDDAPVNGAARHVKIGFGIMMVLVFVLVTAVAVLRPAQLSPTPTAPATPTSSVEPTAPVDPDRAAIERAIAGFYAAADAGQPVTSSPSVYLKGAGGPAPATPEATGTTTFRIARAVVGSETADVYGHESRSIIASAGVEIEFRMRLVKSEWLVSSWQPERASTRAPQSLVLTAATAKDVVGTLLQAHQAGDATTTRLLTTVRFQAEHSSWFDGTDRSTTLTSWEVGSAKAKGKAFLVSVDEQWKPKPLRSTYRVVLTGGEILVDGWTWK